MDIADRPVHPMPRRPALRFVAVFLALYVFAAGIAEITVGRAGQDTAFQKLFAMRGQQVDWLVLGASHALPLAFGDVPGRLNSDTGQTMAVLAETGAGPLYNTFVFEQAVADIAPRRLLYVVDAFAFGAAEWNEDRIADRGLLRKTPLRVSTAAILADISLQHQLNPSALADYLTAFSKLNPPDRFPQPGWQGVKDFERQVRLSRHAVRSRMEFLYPQPLTQESIDADLDVLIALFTKAQSLGLEVVAVKPPLPKAFRDALPDDAAFDAALQARLSLIGVPLNDLSAALPEAEYYFDTDHLNSEGVDAFYTQHLLELLSPPKDP